MNCTNIRRVNYICHAFVFCAPDQIRTGTDHSVREIGLETGFEPVKVPIFSKQDFLRQFTLLIKSLVSTVPPHRLLKSINNLPPEAALVKTARPDTGHTRNFFPKHASLLLCTIDRQKAWRYTYAAIYVRMSDRYMACYIHVLRLQAGTLRRRAGAVLH